MSEELLSSKELSIKEHLLELRNRLMLCVLGFFIAFVVSYLFSEEIYAFLVKPLADQFQGDSSRRMIYTGLTEAFFTYMKVAFFTAFFVTFPLIATQLYIFLAPGLYKREKRMLLPFLLAAPILFLAGGALVYYGIFPLAWKFFLSFEQPAHDGAIAIQVEAKVSEYLSLVMQLIIAFGMAFQLPIVLTLLAKLGVISADSLKKKRKYALLLIVTVAAIITPPDVISQIGLSIPLYLLYECSILAAKWVAKPAQDEAADTHNNSDKQADTGATSHA